MSLISIWAPLRPGAPTSPLLLKVSTGRSILSVCPPRFFVVVPPLGGDGGVGGWGGIGVGLMAGGVVMVAVLGGTVGALDDIFDMDFPFEKGCYWDRER